MIQPGDFVYGTQYWRPPNPPRDQHRYHLEKIKRELGFNLVKLHLQWHWHHREPERFMFDEIHEIFDICESLDLSVMLKLSLECAPYWLEHEHPETRYVNANGRAIELGAQDAAPTGGHPGLCFHHEVVRREAERYLRRVATEFSDRDSLYLYDCWNEPHLEPCWCSSMWSNMGDRVFCYCDGSRQAFRQWLQSKYGDIDTFNDRWGRPYSCFEHVQPPILHGNYADWLDWMRFWFDQLYENMRWRVAMIKAEDAKHPVVSHSGAVPPVLPRANACIHNWRFAEPVDMWGTSFAPQAFSWDLATCAQVLELTRSAARGKPFWVSEMAGGAANIRGFRKSRMPRPKDYHLWNWLAAATGSQGTVHWCYLAERTGHEAGGFGMIRLDGEHTARSRAIAEVAACLRRHQDILTSATVPSQVAVLYDPDVSSLLFAMELDDELYGESHLGYYHTLWKNDLAARYVTFDTLDDIRENVLLVPMALTMSDEVAGRLADFVAGGGVLVAEARTGMFDDRGWMRARVPAGQLAEAAGLTEGEMICSDPANRIVVPGADSTVKASGPVDLPEMDPIHLGPPIRFSEPANVEVPAHGFLVPLELHGAEPIGVYQETAFAARRAYGQGTVYYIGTYLGLALARGVAEAHRLLQAILRQHTVPVVRGDRLRPRLIRGGPGDLLVVFNDHPSQEAEEEVVLPEDAVGAENAVTGQAMPTSDGRIRLSVPPEDAAVLRLTRRANGS